MIGERPTKKIMLTQEVKDYLAERIERENFLLRKDLKIMTFEPGVDTLNKVIAEKPYIVVLPCEMKGMRGFDVCRILKNDREMRNTIIILVSDLSKVDEYREPSQAAKADAYTVFHPSSNVLLQTMANLLNIATRREERISVDMDVDSPNFHAPASGTAKNISENGMLLEVEHCSFERGYPVLLEFRLGQVKLNVHAEIQRMFFRERNKKYDVGVQFKNLSPEESATIKDFIATQQVE